MTLVELLVVLGVIGLLLGMGVPAFTGYARQLRLKAATRQVLGLLSLARSMAISSHEEHAIVIDAAQRRISVINAATGEALDHVVKLPPSVALEVNVGGELSPDARVAFRPSGSLTGRSASFILSDRDRQQVVTVTGATGAVVVEQ